MPDEGEKTEQPTLRRRNEARQKGQVARSQDLSAAVLILIGLLTLDLLGRQLLGRLSALTFALLGGMAPALDPTQLIPIGKHTVIEMLLLLLPVLLIFALAGIVIALLQSGFLFTTEVIKPDVNKLNPVNGLKRMFSPHSLALLVINVLKLGLVGGVVYFTLAAELDRIIYSSSLEFLELIAVGIELFFTLGLRVAAMLLILGIIDYLYQRARHERSLKMTKQEVKEEMRSMEGDPVMKRRRREVQIQLALQRLRKDVPTADVVVTNPTHYAVALRYNSETMQAPRVIAKGQDYIAERIRQLALAAGVPVVERKPLARALFKLVEVGQEVPPQLYKAVAEVLAFVYELSGKRPSAAG